ncbi:MAG TPA: DNA polymerase III subunit gamma and tau, partial [Intrasporangiaceae bacterium]|nr:DNA polymerase III subunit gamma and tau [Intrasporangiaceae bacterium]
MTQALYRRYRPETFADVIGQEHVTAPLQQALRTGRVNHAYLFSGPRGCGKTTSARILARCLNCDQGPTDNPCGTCESCVALARGGAGMVDVVEIDAASHGGVDDARELRERASYGPAQSRYKIYIIDEAHMVTTQGFNALLKIVEEPPEHVKFVFATTEPEKVIGTIRSRTHHYPFRLVPPAQLHTYLESLCQSEGVAVEPGVLSFVVRAGGGSVRDSLSVLDQLIAGSGPEGLTYEGAAALLGFTDAELLDATVTAIGHGDAAEAFAQVDKVIETGLDPRRFVEDLLERLRDLIICAAVPDGVEAVLRGVPTDQIERMRVQAGAFGPGGLSRAADIVNAGLSDMTGATAPRLQLELIIARLLLPGAAGPQGYAARLDRLERRLDLAAAHPSPTGGGASGPAPSRPAQPGPMPPGSTAPAPSPSAPQSAPTQPPPTQSVAAPSATPAAEPSAAPSAAQSPAQPEAGPTHAPPVHAAPAAPTPTPPAPAEPVQPTQSSQPTAGGLDQAAIIRAWPDVVDWLARNKRVTWAFVSENAQPLSFDGSRLVLAITTEGLTETFRRGAHHAFVQEAFMEVLGIDIRVEGVAAGDAPDAGRSGGPV